MFILQKVIRELHHREKEYKKNLIINGSSADVSDASEKVVYESKCTIIIFFNNKKDSNKLGTSSFFEVG